MNLGRLHARQVSYLLNLHAGQVLYLLTLSSPRTLLFLIVRKRKGCGCISTGMRSWSLTWTKLEHFFYWTTPSGVQRMSGRLGNIRVARDRTTTTTTSIKPGSAECKVSTLFAVLSPDLGPNRVWHPGEDVGVFIP